MQEWVERYKTNRAAAAAELMTLLVKVGGWYCVWGGGVVAGYAETGVCCSCGSGRGHIWLVCLQHVALYATGQGGLSGQL